jgi:hypothetical protein
LGWRDSWFFSCFLEDGRNQRFRPPSLIWTDARVAGAGIFGFRRGREILVGAVIFYFRGHVPLTCSTSPEGRKEFCRHQSVPDFAEEHMKLCRYPEGLPDSYQAHSW